MMCKEKVIAHDLPEALAHLNLVKDHAYTALTTVNSLLQRVQDGDLPTKKGITILEVKNHMLLSYLTNLTFLMWRKLNGQKISGETAVERLAEYRTVLEKIRPIEQKLKYQIDKLIKTGTIEQLDPDDPLKFKANPDSLISKLAEDEDESVSDEEKEEKSNIYVPPKLSAVHYEGDETEHDRQQRILERARKRVLSTSIMQELRKEYSEAPEEIKESVDFQKETAAKHIKEKINYEEEYMTRLTVTKKEKNARKKLNGMYDLDHLTTFEDISALDAEAIDDLPMKKKKKLAKKQMKMKKKGKKKGFRKRR
ncbi:neuroguidin-like isoform X2 [Limulus polyphemus]|uniref:Neuroguidin-like isoform X2 n=1 Tax=Limulus polyphemus TaxID=6850 RepID=A0ABM1C4S3_LIMPO|nr:neuroguidin-like isoform X2 [Limulus polyphemus]